MHGWIPLKDRCEPVFNDNPYAKIGAKIVQQCQRGRSEDTIAERSQTDHSDGSGRRQVGENVRHYNRL
jgi:hypothetical protein